MSKTIACWRCDVCEELIEEPSHGYVIWKKDAQHRAYDFKIIHQAKCDRDDPYFIFGVRRLPWSRRADKAPVSSEPGTNQDCARPRKVLRCRQHR